MTRLNETFVPFASFIVIKFMTGVITKTALTKLLENTLDENSKLKNMFDERLGCPMKSLLINHSVFTGQCPTFWKLIFRTLG